MAVGLSFAAKGLIAVVLILIVGSVYGKSPKIVQAGMETVDRNLEAVGINIIDIPKILSLTVSVEPDGYVAVTWKLNRDGQKIDDQYFKAVFSYKKYPDDLIDDVCAVKHIDQETPKPGWTCSVENDKRTAVLKKEGCAGPDCLDSLAGLYKIDVSFEKKSGFRIQKHELETVPPFAFYTENYVEFLDKSITGCSDSTFHDCNVIECKKELINKDLNDPLLIARDVREPLVKAISDSFSTRRPGCGDYRDNGETFILNLDNCNKEEVDDLNTKFARVRLLETAFELQKVTSEGQYTNHLDRLEFWKEKALKMTMSCTKGFAGRPKGAEVVLKSLGWQRYPQTGVNIWEGRINGNLNSLLDKLRPAIADAVAGANNYKQVVLVWKLPLGKDRLKNYELKLFYSNAAVKDSLAEVKKLDVANKLKLSEVALPKQPVPNGEMAYKYPESTGLASDGMGAYWFVLSAFDESVSSIDTKEAYIGIYDNQYIELYRDFERVDDACGSGCDVAGKKEDALGYDRFGWSNVPGATKKPEETYVYIARCSDSVSRFKGSITNCGDNGGKFQASCQLDKSKVTGNARITGCTNEEVNLLYRLVADAYSKDKDLPSGKVVGDLLKVDCISESALLADSRYKDTRITEVCRAKDSLKKWLDKNMWANFGS